MKITKFNCVEMKRRGAEKVAEKTKHMTRKQELAFWQIKNVSKYNRQESGQVCC